MKNPLLRVLHVTCQSDHAINSSIYIAMWKTCSLAWDKIDPCLRERRSSERCVCNYLDRKVEWDKNDPPAGCQRCKYALCLVSVSHRDFTSAAKSRSLYRRTADLNVCSTLTGIQQLWECYKSTASRVRQWPDEQNLIVGCRQNYLMHIAGGGIVIEAIFL
jgi:hypothetical protein